MITKEEFIEYVYHINYIILTDDQFYGKRKINNSLRLEDLTEIPEGFNPYVGGDLYLNSLTSIPEGFNPNVGGNLYLNNLTSIPKGFNPIVNGSLYLNGITHIPEGFNPKVGGGLDLQGLNGIPENWNPTNINGDIYIKNDNGNYGIYYTVNRELNFINFNI